MPIDTSALFQNGSVSSISREELAALPIRRYEGEVRTVVTAADLRRAALDFSQESVVGVDTETRPSFRKGESYPPALVQVATDRAVYLFRPADASVQQTLTALLEDAAVAKAGVALAHDLRALGQVFRYEPRNVVDLGRVARRSGYAQTGLRNLAGMFLDFRIPKGASTSNWAAPSLTAQQIRYAATDAWACRELFLRFETLGLLDD